MKKQILFVMAFYCPYVTQAQPVLNKIEGFKVGTKITTHNVQPGSITAGPGGGNVTWNFSSLPVANDTLVMEILATASTPYGAAFPTADYAEKHGDGGLAYIDKVGNTAQLLGFQPPASSVMWYHNPYTFLKSPFGYQDLVDDTASRGYKLLGDSLAGTGVTRTTADGWGTLILPNGTYNNVLRIKFEQDFYDTAQISNVVTHTRTATYGWFDTGHYSSLLKIDSIIIQSPVYQDTIVSVQVLKREIVTGVPNTIWKEKIHAFSTDKEIIIAGMLREEDVITVTIYDGTGREVDKLNLHQQNAASKRAIDISHLPQGQLYIARLAIKRNDSIWQSAVKVLR